MKNISFRDDVLPLKNLLYRLALRITLDHAEAEDIVQETMIKVWNRRDTWQEIESMEAFCTTICRNLALDHIKKKAHQNASLDEKDIDQADTASTPYEDMLQKDRLRLIRDLVNSLPEKQRSCMQLRDFEGKQYREIARLLGISEEQVKINIFRARQAIKNKFKKADQYGL